MKNKTIKSLLYDYGIFLVFLLLVVFFAFLTNGKALSIRNILNLVLNMVPIALIAMGVTIVIITTGIDLSSGSVAAFSGVFAAIFAQRASEVTKVIPWLPDLPFFVPILVGVGAGALAGWVNGLIITRTKIPPFIATLGMMTAGRGLALLPTKGATVGGLDPVLVFLGQGKLLGIPMPIWILAVMIVITHILLAKTRFGRYAYAIGGNIVAAQTSGIDTDKALVRIYLYAGVLSGLAGVVITSLVASGQPRSGMLYELDAIASSVIGGTSLYGGIGTIPGAIVGSLIIGLIKNGLDLMFVSAYWQQIVRGLIIVLAVVIDVQKRRFRSEGYHRESSEKTPTASTAQPAG